METYGKNILDIGCGPGHWTFAMAKLNPNASVIGIDINNTELSYAERYKTNNKIKNCNFINISYEEIPKIFDPNSFDVIICNSIIQFIDERKVFNIISSLLRPNGILLMFYNPDKGYYLKRLIQHIYYINVLGIVNCMLILAGLSKYIPVSIRGKYPEHYVTFKECQKALINSRIVLEKIHNNPKLEYDDRFLWLTSVFSCKGRKV